MSLLACASSSACVGPTFDVKTHILGDWSKVGTCQFLQCSDTVVEVSGSAGIAGVNYNFDIKITDGSDTTQPILTVNGTPDWKATLSGCTVQAGDTLGGIQVTFKSYETINTELETPDPYPNIFINPQ